MTTTKKYYFLSKKLKEEAHYNAEGKREGLTRIFYRNGTVKKELLYKNGRKEGHARRFFKDGTRFEYKCKDGREKTGIWKNYNENDLLVRFMDFLGNRNEYDKKAKSDAKWVRVQYSIKSHIQNLIETYHFVNQM